MPGGGKLAAVKVACEIKPALRLSSLRKSIRRGMMAAGASTGRLHFNTAPA